MVSQSNGSPATPLKFLIYGRTGWIGGLLGKPCESQGIDYTYASGRLESSDTLIAYIVAVNPTHVFDAAGVTGRPNVDWCESHKVETIRTNVVGTLTLADVCREKGLILINYATRCIFEYDSEHQLGSGVGFKEEDTPNFIGSYYSRTKAMVQFAAGRDLRPGQLGNMIHTLSDWLGTSDNLLISIQDNIKWADTMSELDKKHKKENEERLEEVKNALSLKVQFAAGRDLRPGQLGNMIHTLSIWLGTSDNLLISIQDNIKWADTMSELDKKHKKENEERLEEVKNALSLKDDDCMTRNRIHDDDDDDASSSSRKEPETCALWSDLWSDLDHDLLRLVMMKLGFGDYYSFRGVCMSWRSIARSSENKFMASMPPMSLSISSDAHDQKACHLKDFQGRKFKTFLPHSAVDGVYVGLTCGYLIFYVKKTRDFLLVNPITSKELHFPDFPKYCDPRRLRKVILVFSPSISGLVLVVLYNGEIQFSVAGKGAWNHVSHGFHITDLYAFQGKIYTLTYNLRYSLHDRFCLCELRLGPQPKLTILGIKKPDYFYPKMFVSSGESLYVMLLGSETLSCLHELDLGEMELVKPCEKTFEEYAFFRSYLNHVGIAVKRESWADPRSRSLGRFASFPNTDDNGDIRFFTAKMWYFPHESINVDCIDEWSTTLV